jgi:hypothetical protein
MDATTLPELTYCGKTIDTSPAHFGALRVSIDALDDREELRRRMTADGYLYLPGYIDRDQVIEARHAVLERLPQSGLLDLRFPLSEGIVKPGKTLSFMPQLTHDNPALDQVLYAGSMMEFYEFFLDGPVRHFDYTWFRAKTPGINTATQPHCDIVYMGRGTQQLYTSWTPLSDVPYEMGGLMVLEHSHRIEELVQTYGQTDVDAYCENEGGRAREIVEQAQAEKRELSAEERKQIRWNSSGAYGTDALEVQHQLGARWLTAEYQMGDLLVFCMYLMHASSDNQTKQIRLSSDSRYQLSSDSVDERWIGEQPPTHGIRAKRGVIC